MAVGHFSTPTAVYGGGWPQPSFFERGLEANFEKFWTRHIFLKICEKYKIKKLFFLWWREMTAAEEPSSTKFHIYSLCPKINVILKPSTQTNMRCKMTKLPFVFYEKDLGIGISFV
jgi:hypothetical protein